MFPREAQRLFDLGILDGIETWIRQTFWSALFLKGITSMPYVNVQITHGATRKQKAAVVQDITTSLVRHLGKHPEHIHIVIQEIAEENWGFAGLLTDDWKRQRQDGTQPTSEN